MVIECKRAKKPWIAVTANLGRDESVGSPVATGNLRIWFRQHAAAADKAAGVFVAVGALNAGLRRPVEDHASASQRKPFRRMPFHWRYTLAVLTYAGNPRSSLDASHFENASRLCVCAL